MDKAKKGYFPKAVTFAIRQLIDTNVNTAEPGVIEEYDPETQRARIRLAMRRAFVDKSPSMAKAPLLNVPVLQAATGGYMIHQQVDPGDIVLVVFSKESLERFKQTWGETDPVRGSRFTDAVAILWGKAPRAPAQTEGIVIQSADGETYIHVVDGKIEMRVGRGRFRMTDGNADFWRE